MKTYWKCVVCSAVFEGTLPPEICPVCKAGREAFIPCIKETVDYRNDSSRKFAIIGSGAAAVAAAESIRKRDATAEIRIFTREEALPYYRPVLIRALHEKIKDKDYYIHPAPFYKNRQINIDAGKNVISVNLMEKSISTGNGEKAGYDKLLIAIGAKNFIPPIAGISLPQVISLRELPDFEKLKKLLVSPKKIIVIGGGLLGLETAGTLSYMGHDLTVVESRTSILPKQTDAESSAMLSQIINRFGVKIIINSIVTEIYGVGSVKGVKFDSGNTLDADIVLISTGITSNIEIAKLAGLACGRGISVDKYMKTSDDSVFAAGDCAEFNSSTDGIWESSLEQGRVAGANMAGETKAFETKIFGTVLNSFGTKLFSIGDFWQRDSQDKYEKIGGADPSNSIYRAFYFRDGKNVGGILLGDTRLTCNLIAAVTNGWDIEESVKNGLS